MPCLVSTALANPFQKHQTVKLSANSTQTRDGPSTRAGYVLLYMKDLTLAYILSDATE